MGEPRDPEWERRAHASGECCTGSVIVEAPVSKSSSTASWLRSSMRRVRHFRLPSDATTAQQESLEVVVDTSIVRPVSAPSRLAEVQRSRSRSRGVQQGRVRSRSASSRSRRQTSLSSSVTSLASTVDSSHSCTPAPTPVNVVEGQRQNSIGGRR